MENIISKIIKGEFVLIAEIGVNYYDIAEKLHISNMEAARLMILEAKNAGIHAVKFQTYKADTLASKDSPAYWDLDEEKISSQYELFQKFDSFGKEEYAQLASFCSEIGIEFLSTAFDYEAADYLDEMMGVYKISSSDLNNFPFIEYQAKKNKPMIVSVGASNLDEIRCAVQLIRKYNQQPLVLMHCVLEYPTPYEHANLRKIKALGSEFQDVYIGYSDHTKPDKNYDVVKVAYLLGARVVEKHFTLDKKLQGNDHYHAMDGHDAQMILQEIKWLDTILGNEEIRCLKSEEKARSHARRSLVAKADIKKGTRITEDMIICKRPGTGIRADQMDEVIGAVARVSIKRDTVLHMDMLESL
ncbi:MAG: N-acetylneuraminate synthase family protein [Ruminococcus flavefaciens]|nr:N-acetylneuraminate synthase family protein [Ruminococcus flavefaciens]